MLQRFDHNRLLRYAGLFTWAVIGLPLLLLLGIAAVIGVVSGCSLVIFPLAASALLSDQRRGELDDDEVDGKVPRRDEGADADGVAVDRRLQRGVQRRDAHVLGTLAVPPAQLWSIATAVDDYRSWWPWLRRRSACGPSRRTRARTRRRIDLAGERPQPGERRQRPHQPRRRHRHLDRLHPRHAGSAARSRKYPARASGRT